MLIEIGDKIVASDIFTEKFVCDLVKCKGACCVEGDDGAPVSDEEIEILESLYDEIKPFMTAKGIAKVEDDGVFYKDESGDSVTTLVEGGACAFAYFEKDGTAKCAIEKAYRSGVIDWKKPLSCELFPIRVKKYSSFTAVNYEKIDICKPACQCGSKLNVPVYKFLKEPIEKAFGEEFFKELETVHTEIKGFKPEYGE
ncbi:MAG: DUF3109 family protein [Brumimicrobium sp.]|nr:DUF3109 family protein [Brumimicrobium sp.]